MRRLFTFLLLLESAWLGAQIPCNGQFLTVGSATNQGACIQMTPNAPSQQGCAWLNTPVDFSQPFTHNMTANFGNIDANGADGICLVYQPNGPGVCGNLGGGIGAEGIPNSFIVEFDTWDNGPAKGDIPQDHCAIDLNGNFAAPLNGPVSLGNIEDGANHTISFSWNPAGNNYSVSFDGTPVLSGTYDIVNLIFGGNTQAYWGYTASTGAATNLQLICPSLPPQINVDAGVSVEIPCIGAQVMLDGTGSDFAPDYVYSWSTIGGNIVSGGNTLTPIVDAPGVYTLTLTDTSNGCEETDQVTVNLNPLQAIIAPPPFITCNQPTFLLNGSASSSGPFISYQWTTLDGMIVSGANSPILEIASEGTYTLTVIYSNNGNICTEEATVQVMPNPNVPVANAADGMISCYFPVTQLSGIGSSTGSTYAYEWTTFDGDILSGANTLFPTVGAPGIYTLTVYNINTGCTDEISVIVDGDLEQPDAAAMVNGALGCQTPQLTIDALASSQGPAFSYSWATSNGNIISGETTLTPVVDAPGAYTLTVLNLVNGCEAFTTVIVAAGPSALSVDAQAPGVLNCSTTELTLDGSNSGQGQYYEYLWTTSNGNIVSGANTLAPVVDAPGTYTLTILNTEDGCTGADSVTVAQDISAPAAEAGNPQMLSCGDASLSLDGSGSAQGPAITYQWSTPNGNIVSGGTGLNPLINAPGTYFLNVTNSLNGCVSIDSVAVSSDANAPSLVLLVGDTLDCSTAQVTIDAAGSSTGPNFDYEWTTANGNFISTADSLLVAADAPGQYSLAITDLSNNCTSTSTVTVIQDVELPVAAIAPPDTLDCAATVLMLDASASSQGPQYGYQWTTSGGNILSGGQSLSPQADAPGLYELQVTNLQNACTSTAAVSVYQDTLSPVVQIAPPAMLNCLIETVNLDAAGSSQGAPYSFSWTTSGGNITGNVNSLSPTANAPGIYTLQIINTQNACQSEASVEVQQDTLHPQADAGADQVLNCYNPSLQLDGQQSSQGAGLSYEWTAVGGQPLSGANTLTPTIDQPGIYQLQVENTLNGCTATDEVQVSADFSEPTVGIASPDILTCTNSAVTIDGSSSSMGANFQYFWSTPDGSILSGGQTPQAVVSQAGAYVLQVLNADNGCAVSDSVQVTQDVNVPMAQVASPQPLTCARLSVVLDASGSSQGSGYALQWSTADGNILAGSQTLTPEVNAPGTYLLTVTSLLNDCEVMASTQVLIDTVAPAVAAGPAPVLSCLAPSLSLDGSGTVQGSQYSYQWTTSSGNILSGGDGLSPLVDAPGNYTLLVTNTENGCSQSASVAVSEDFETPAIAIAAPEVLNCIRASVQLDATASDSGPSLTYEWTTQGGQLLSGADALLATAGAPGTYILSVYNQNNGCSDTLSVMVAQDTTPPVAAIATPGPLTCAVETLQLDAGSSSTGPSYQYQWATGVGAILNGANSLSPEVGAPGFYDLLVTNQENGCRDSASVEVMQDVAAPTIAIAAPEILACSVTELELDAAASSTGPDFAYLWTTGDGLLLGGENTLQATVGAPGLYQLLILNQDNGCADSLSVQVQQDITPPVVQIAPPAILTCLVEELALNAGASSTGPSYQYQWTTTDGMIISGADGPAPLVNAPGSYVLSILNQDNGCSTTGEVMVQQDITPPTVVIGNPATLTCVVESVVLDGNGSSAGSIFQYQWQTPDGNIVAGVNTLQATADAPGQYFLEVLNTENGCSSQASTVLEQDVLAPVVQLAPPNLLTCSVTETTLDGSASSSGSPYQYQWETNGGNIISGDNTLFPVVNAPGFYQLTITNIVNGCTEQASVSVGQDIQPPVAEAGSDFVLPCFEDQRQLDGTGSSAGAGLVYQWATANGNLVGGQTTLSPAIDAPGIYTLLVTNTANGCQSEDEVVVSQDIPTAEDALVQPPCYGDPGAILVESVNGGLPPYLFSIDGGDSFQPTPVFQQLAAGLYEVVVQDINGCEYRLAQEVEQPDSLVVLAAEAEATVLLGAAYQINALVNVPLSELAWISWGNRPDLSCDDCLDPLASPGESTDYRVRVRSINGCEDVAMVRVYVDKRPNVFIPNAFSPNGDGANDLFLIFARAESVEKVRSFYIFNRWGEPVFQAFNFPPNDPRYGWDGTFREEPMNPAVFSYFAEIEFVDGSVELFKGGVQLVK